MVTYSMYFNIQNDDGMIELILAQIRDNPVGYLARYLARYLAIYQNFIKLMTFSAVF